MGAVALEHVGQELVAGAVAAGAPRFLTMADVGAWCESVYTEAACDPVRVPWARDEADPALVAWLNAEAPALVRPGARVAVVGCGLGYDAAAIARRGYDVDAFDIAPAAVEWARGLHGDLGIRFMTADASDPPARLRHRFDLVVEVCTLASVAPAIRSKLVEGMADLLGPHGTLLAISCGRADTAGLESLQGPPYPLTAGEMAELMSGVQLTPLRPISDFLDEGDPPRRWIRGAFSRIR